MSASKQKKIRQELAAQGIQDPKVIREAEEKAKQKKANTMYLTIAVVFVIVAALLLVNRSGVFQRNATAVTIDGEKYTPGQVEYFYRNAYSSVTGGQYAAYLGLDTKKPLDQQELNETAKVLLGVESEEPLTWDAFLRDKAVENMTEVLTLAKAAEAEGFAFTEEMQAEVDSNFEALNTYAAQNGYSAKAYLKLIYGNYMTTDIFRDLLHKSVLAEGYEAAYIESLVYTDAELEAAYPDEKEHLDQADYEYIYFAGTASPTTDADGNTVDATEEEIAAAKQAAADALAEAQERYAAGEGLETIAADYDIASYAHITAGTASGSQVTDWVFDEARAAGDTTAIDSDPNAYFVLFHSAGRPEWHPVNVRHILFMISDEVSDADAKAKAEDALAQWQAGDATEDSFAALANELSEDGGSNTNGGLYESVPKGQMVLPFENWIFDESRQVGDAGIVFVESTNYSGYHVIYYAGCDDMPYWASHVQSELQSEDLSAWVESLTGPVAVEQGSGMKYVG